MRCNEASLTPLCKLEPCQLCSTGILRLPTARESRQRRRCLQQPLATPQASVFSAPRILASANLADKGLQGEGGQCLALQTSGNNHSSACRDLQSLAAETSCPSDCGPAELSSSTSRQTSLSDRPLTSAGSKERCRCTRDLEHSTEIVGASCHILWRASSRSRKQSATAQPACWDFSSWSTPEYFTSPLPTSLPARRWLKPLGFHLTDLTGRILMEECNDRLS